ncbi:hypothetical protein DQ04_05131060 [Trypanosoma grayi]|uniref:hypothetical protein n=1 Tax=Trypanosoma grayi TaxID=71804 RepID=UPI0004F42202|nr:hypothetical protein DQ04_05131060 [Trypanosoma grayi]KEG09491.1 hypothetical protein DQ04_05131060 [Trypanosoma grayi]
MLCSCVMPTLQAASVGVGRRVAPLEHLRGAGSHHFDFPQMTCRTAQQRGSRMVQDHAEHRRNSLSICCLLRAELASFFKSTRRDGTGRGHSTRGRVQQALAHPPPPTDIRERPAHIGLQGRCNTPPCPSDASVAAAMGPQTAWDPFLKSTPHNHPHTAATPWVPCDHVYPPIDPFVLFGWELCI